VFSFISLKLKGPQNQSKDKKKKKSADSLWAQIRTIALRGTNETHWPMYN